MDNITLHLTPGEAFTLQEALRTADAVHAAQRPEDGDILQAVSQEAALYTKLRDRRISAVSKRIGKAYATHIKGKATRGTKSTRAAAKPAKPRKPAKPKRPSY